MIRLARASEAATMRSTLKIHLPAADIPSSARWLINGFPAKVLIWTAEDWACLTDQPSDAQPCPNGVWCALRME
jgi:hypothetical protein